MALMTTIIVNVTQYVVAVYTPLRLSMELEKYVLINMRHSRAMITLR
jgi:hypothetical protein